jgi:hypothetical protein
MLYTWESARGTCGWSAEPICAKNEEIMSESEHAQPAKKSRATIDVTLNVRKLQLALTPTKYQTLEGEWLKKAAIFTFEYYFGSSTTVADFVSAFDGGTNDQ